MKQSVFTVIAELDDDLVGRAELKETLATIGRELDQVRIDPGATARLPLQNVERLHFASITLREGSYPSIIFELNVDGSISEAVDDLATDPALAPGLDLVFRHCPGWQTEGPAAFLTARVQKPAAFHIGNTGRSKTRILDEEQVVDEVGRFLDETDDLPLDPDALAAAVRGRVRETHPWAEAAPPPNRSLGQRLVAGVGIVPAAAAAIGIVVTGGWLLWKEKGDRERFEPPPPVPPALALALEQTEDEIGSIQNHLTSIVPIRRGPYRRFVLRSVLYVIDRAARLLFTKGKLGSVSTIHFAHWSIIDDGDSLLFLSNFDGSWESYLDDFIEKVAVGLTAVWSNCDGFPPTRTLVKEGARHGPEFKAWARGSQLETPVWFQAYPRLGVTDIDHNSMVRAGLGSSSGKEAAAWLEKL